MFMAVFIFNKVSELGWPSFYKHAYIISLVTSLDVILFDKRLQGTDLSARMRRLVCACVICKPSKTCFLASRPIWMHVYIRHLSLRYTRFLSSTFHIGLLLSNLRCRYPQQALSYSVLCLKYEEYVYIYKKIESGFLITISGSIPFNITYLQKDL